MGERLRAFGMLNLVLALDGVRSSRGLWMRVGWL